MDPAPFQPRASTLTWLFAGQRSDEIARLRLGYIRWQHDQPAANGDLQSTDSSVCLPDIPTHKIGTAPPSPNPSTRSWAGRSKHGRPDDQCNHRCWTGKPARRCISCSLSEAGRISKNDINDMIIPALFRKIGILDADHQPPRSLRHRHTALQRQGTDDTVRAALVSLGSTMTSATGIAATPSSSNSRTAVLRPLRLLHSQRVQQKRTAAREIESAADTRQYPARRR